MNKIIFKHRHCEEMKSTTQSRFWIAALPLVARNDTLRIMAAVGLIAFAPYSANAQNMDHHGHDMSNKTHAQGTQPKPDDYNSPPVAPERVEGMAKYAIDEPGDKQSNFGVVSMHDNEMFWQVMGDRLEYRTHDGEDVLLWDGDAWIGRDYNKFYLESEGEWNAGEGSLESASVEAFWNYAFLPFWDTQLGLRHDFKPGDSRTFAAAGVQGMVPYKFEVDATGYVSEDGDASAVFEVERSWYLTQRIAAQPRFETEIAASDVPEYNTGAGMTGFELGLRTRYDINRKFSPYIGVSWEQNVGETANMIEEDGGDTSSTAFVAGVQFWF